MTTSNSVKGVGRVPHRYSRTSLHHFDSGAKGILLRRGDGTLSDEGQQIIGAMDELLSQAWKQQHE
jgi:hypothetical protein